MQLEVLPGSQGRCKRSVGKSRHRPARISRHTPWKNCSRQKLLFKEMPNPAQDRRIHGERDAACLRILLTWVVYAKQSRSARRHFGFRAVRKLVEPAGGNHSTQL